MQRLVFRRPARIILTDGDEGGRADGHGISAERQGLRHVGAVPDAARNDELHLAVHAEILQRLHGRANAGERRHADMLDEDFLRRRSTALHAIEHDDIGAGLHCKGRVVIGARTADLHVDRFFPVGDLAQFEDLDLKVVGAGPVGMTACRTLIDTLRQRSHLGDAVGNLLTEQHAAATGLGTLANDDLDCVAAAQIPRVHAVARR